MHLHAEVVDQSRTQKGKQTFPKPTQLSPSLGSHQDLDSKALQRQCPWSARARERRTRDLVSGVNGLRESSAARLGTRDSPQPTHNAWKEPVVRRGRLQPASLGLVPTC